jgi:hypothetical protein
MQNLKILINLRQNQTLKMIYQASKDGFSSGVFHTKCNGVLGTLTVIKTSSNTTNIFGGYTQADWSGYTWQYDSNAFLFSLVNSYNTPVKMLVFNPQNAIYASSYYGPTFGGGHDLYLSSDSSYGYSNLGYSYQVPSFLTSSQSFLAGSYSFKPIEIEVYAIFLDRNIIFFNFLKMIL